MLKQATRPTRYLSLQAGRGIASVMVLLFHSEIMLSNPKYWGHPGWKKFFYCGHSGVDFFFVLSGFVILHTHLGDIGRATRLSSYVWKRFRRVYPIYWLVLLLVIPVYLMIPSFGYGYETQPTIILQALLLVHINRLETILQVAWTLYHEVLFYALFALLLWKRRLGIGVMSIWLLGSFVCLITSFPPLLGEYFSPLHLLFGLGMWIAMLTRKRLLPGWPLALIGSTAFVFCCVRDGFVQRTLPALDLCYGCAAAMALAGFVALEQREALRIPRFLLFLGDASYSIYLVHFLILSAAGKVFHSLWIHHPVPYVVPFALMASTALLGGVMIHLLIEKPLLRLTDNWFSVERSKRASLKDLTST